MFASMNIRTGIGYDVHRFTEGRKLMIGGVEIPFDKGLEGHSDADILLHSICDAILGAAGLKDIGHQFPNTDPEFKNISSLLLLERTFELVNSHQWKIGNIDCVVVLEEPKINNYIEEMKNKISSVLRSENISIKATTSEGLGFIGNNKGCAAYTTVLIYK
jgi:2-C-methyl-D-erythritol 2,4-cyclodiphosphate synthase